MSNIPIPIEAEDDEPAVFTMTPAEFGIRLRAYLLANNLGVPPDLHQQGDPVPGHPIINIAPAPVTLPAIPAAPAHTKHPKIATPDTYSGDHSQWKQFKAQCQLYIDTRFSEFPDDRAKVSFMLSYMKGGMAGPWALNSSHPTQIPASLIQCIRTSFSISSSHSEILTQVSPHARSSQI
jgi:hypothetical protein